MRAHTPKLLTRDQFREGVLARDGHRCVLCGRGVADGVKLDAHHVMERRLWWTPEQLGGYFLENGATCCDTDFRKTQVPQPDGTTKEDWSCHLKCGMTLISPDDVRRAAGIDTVLLPEHLYPDMPYTVWGDGVLPDGRRIRGELFQDESVQELLRLAGVLGRYTKYVRHFRTFHLPYSPKVLIGEIGDDRVMHDTSHLDGRECVVTAKVDGGQTTLYDDYLHLRSIDFKADPTTARLQALHSKLRHVLAGLRVNVENLVGSAVADIQYRNLSSYYQVFMIWDNDRNVCLSWDETAEYAAMIDDVVRVECGEAMGMPLVPVLYRGPYSRAAVEAAYTPTLGGDPLEGLVVRTAEAFHYGRSAKCVGKYVRAAHRVRHCGPYRANSLGVDRASP